MNHNKKNMTNWIDIDIIQPYNSRRKYISLAFAEYNINYVSDWRFHEQEMQIAHHRTR